MLSRCCRKLVGNKNDFNARFHHRGHVYATSGTIGLREFLWQKYVKWPIEPVTTEMITTGELRANIFYHTIALKSCIIVENLSSWKRLVRSAAFVFRYWPFIQHGTAPSIELYLQAQRESCSGLKPASCPDDSAVALKRSYRASQVEANIF